MQEENGQAASAQRGNDDDRYGNETGVRSDFHESSGIDEANERDVESRFRTSRIGLCKGP